MKSTQDIRNLSLFITCQKKELLTSPVDPESAVPGGAPSVPGSPHYVPEGPSSHLAKDNRTKQINTTDRIIQIHFIRFNLNLCIIVTINTVINISLIYINLRSIAYLLNTLHLHNDSLI